MVEISRLAALKLQSQVPSAKAAIQRISIERQLLQMFGSGLTREDVAPLVEAARVEEKRAGEVVVAEGADDKDVFIIRRGSMVVEKEMGGRPVFLSYLPAGTYFGEMAVIDGSARTASVKAAIKSEVIRIDGAGGKTYVPRERYSLMMSFCTVPCSAAISARRGSGSS